MMANPRRYTQLPRFLLPRLTWNGEVKGLSTSPLKAVVNSTTQHRLPALQKQRRFSTGASAVHPPKSFPKTTAIRRFSNDLPTPKLSPPSHTRPLDPSGPPIRHNGVYVAVFKPARRAFHSTPVRARDHHFDTLKFVQRLKDEGFSEEQAVAMMRVLSDVVEESIQNLTRTMVLREGKPCHDDPIRELIASK
jgi:Protein of unknown function (DUF1640)